MRSDKCGESPAAHPSSRTFPTAGISDIVYNNAMYSSRVLPYRERRSSSSIRASLMGAKVWGQTGTRVCYVLRRQGVAVQSEAPHLHTPSFHLKRLV